MGISSLAIIRIFSASVLRGLSSAWRRIGNWVLKMAMEIPLPGGLGSLLSQRISLIVDRKNTGFVGLTGPTAGT
jgi:hypothetical protein